MPELPPQPHMLNTTGPLAGWYFDREQGLWVNFQTGETKTEEDFARLREQTVAQHPQQVIGPTQPPIAAEDAQDDTDGLGGGPRLDPQALAQQRQSDRRLDMGTRLLETLATAGANIFGARDARKADRRTAQSGARANLINALAGNIVAQPTQRQATPGVGTSDRKSTRLNSSHSQQSRMPSSA